jgi:nicotinate-nucleotide adenylyltransferase
MKLGIFGGAFDPIHIGHLIIAEEVREHLKLSKILFVPTYKPPHKECRASYAHRRNMVNLAIRTNPFFALCEIEKTRKTTSWTIKTLENLRRIYPEDEFYLIIGSDQFQKISTWKNPEKLTHYAKLVIIPRPHADVSFKTTAQIIFLKISQIDIASRKIREDIKHNRSVKYKIVEDVLSYIYQHKLYK